MVENLGLSERKFKSLLDSSPDAVVIANKTGEIRMVNKQTENIFGYSKNDLVGKNIEMFIPERFRNNYTGRGGVFFSKSGLKTTGSRLELFGMLKNGSEFPVEISISPFRMEGGIYVSATIRDITERKKQEKELNEMATIIASSSDAIISKSLDGHILTWNRGAEKILGYTPDEIKGKHISILFPPELLHEEEILMSKILSGENVIQYETTRIKKDRSRIGVSITLSAIKDKYGQIIGISKILRDVTAHRKAEFEAKSLLNLTIGQNDRLKNFAHIVSHNLRSHSANIAMLLNMYIEKTPGVAGNKFLSNIKIASDNLNETIENLNEVVLMNAGVKQSLVPIQLNCAINAAIINASQSIDDSEVQIINKVDDEITIMGLPAYIDSILLNFLTNAVKYRSPDRQSTVVLSTAVQKNLVVLSIEDNGVGIDMKKNGDKLFGMYKTFHGNEDARGIGLFITKNQIEAIGAKVSVESEIDKGTLIKITFNHE
jgi:PAS domain S-box-containing protein